MNGGDVFTSKKIYEPNYIQSLIQDCECWKDLYENGCFDPNWCDGVNLNLVRNRIISLKRLIRENPTLEELPECFYEDDPPEVDRDYMAQPDRIREDAGTALAAFEADENLKFVREQARHLPEKVCKKLLLPAVLWYADGLKHYIKQDMLLEMRRYRTFDHYLDSFKSAADRIRDPKILAELDNQPMLADDDEDGYFDEEQEFSEQAEEFSTEPEQDEPEEELQLRLI